MCIRDSSRGALRWRPQGSRRPFRRRRTAVGTVIEHYVQLPPSRARPLDAGRSATASALMGARGGDFEPSDFFRGVPHTPFFACPASHPAVPLPSRRSRARVEHETRVPSCSTLSMRNTHRRAVRQGLLARFRAAESAAAGGRRAESTGWLGVPRRTRSSRARCMCRARWRWPVKHSTEYCACS